jgi:hypothetical protein
MGVRGQGIRLDMGVWKIWYPESVCIETQD